jgi:hypothetical protein
MFLPPGDPNVVNARLDFDPIDRFLWANLPYAVDWHGAEGDARMRPRGYITDYFADEAVNAIEANRNRPFFLYLSFTAAHTPLQATREDYDALAAIPDHTQRVYGAMIRSLDRGVGRVMQALSDNGIDDNTIVIFVSDNGGAWYTGLAGHQRAVPRLEIDLLRRRHSHALLRALAGRHCRAANASRPGDAHGHLRHRRRGFGRASSAAKPMASICCLTCAAKLKARRTSASSGAQALIALCVTAIGSCKCQRDAGSRLAASISRKIPPSSTTSRRKSPSASPRCAR